MKICRVCLEKSTDCIELIEEYKKKFYHITGIELENCKNEEALCNVCFDQLLNAWTFRENAIKADFYYKDKYSNKSNETNLSSLENDVKFEVYVEGGSSLPMDDVEEIERELEVIQKTQNERLKYSKQEKSKVRPYICDLCGSRFTCFRGILDHIRVHKKELGKKCRFCEKTFPNRSTMSAHERYHAKRDNRPKVVCEHCGLVCAHQGILNNHLRSHKETYQCTFTDCSKSFPRKKALHRHLIVTHAIRSPLACEICGKGCANISALGFHKRIAHPTDPNCVLVCNECPNAKFLSKKNLDLHIASKHRGEKNFVCDVCSACFTYPYNLRRHIKCNHFEEYLKMLKSGKIRQEHKSKKIISFPLQY